MNKDRSFYEDSFSSIDELLNDEVDNLFPDYLMSFFGIDRGDILGFRALPEEYRKIVSVCLYEPQVIIGEMSEFIISSGFCINELLLMLDRFELSGSVKVLFAFNENYASLLGQKFSYENEDDLIDACSAEKDFADATPLLISEAEGLLNSLQNYCLEHLDKLRKFEAEISQND